MTFQLPRACNASGNTLCKTDWAERGAENFPCRNEEKNKFK